jgi:competence protein ComFC
LNVLTLLRDVFEDKACFLCGEESRLPVCPDCISTFRRCDEGWCSSQLAAGTLFGFSAYWYEGALRQAILQMKVQGEYQIAPELASMVAFLAKQCLQFSDRPVFVPIPRFGGSEQETPRQFPQIACNMLSTALNGEPGNGLLRKIRQTPLQTQLSDMKRLTNLADVFEVSSDAAGMLKGRTVIIIDDVLTTGATVHEAVRSILKTRPHQCLYLTLARSRATIRTGL